MIFGRRTTDQRTSRCTTTAEQAGKGKRPFLSYAVVAFTMRSHSVMFSTEKFNPTNIQANKLN
jgi:hypothetical protein